MDNLLISIYPWTKTLHILAVISWMAGLLYLPRLMVYHVERTETGNLMDVTFQLMEQRLFQVIMTPAMIASWLFGVILALTPGVVDWLTTWPWIKSISIVALTMFHHWINERRKDFCLGENKLTGRQFRILNEVPTILMVLIVSTVVFKF